MKGYGSDNGSHRFIAALASVMAQARFSIPASTYCLTMRETAPKFRNECVTVEIRTRGRNGFDVLTKVTL